MSMEGIVAYLLFFATMAGIYAILTLGLNIQWGYTGLFNIGIAGFFALGAYTSAILTSAPHPSVLGGFGLPFPVGFAAAGLVSGVASLLIGLPTLRLREDYLAIASIGIAETIRYIFINERWLANGTRGIAGIPNPMRALFGPYANVAYLLLVAVVIALLYLLIERAIHAPWGRVLRSIREDEHVSKAVGKDVFRFKLQALVMGSVVMGLAGSLYTHFISFVGPQVFEPMLGTFIVWVMLTVGGTGSNKGAIVGAFVVWAIWSMTEFLTDLLPSALATRTAPVRVILIGLLLIAALLWRPAGLIGPDREAAGRSRAKAVAR